MKITFDGCVETFIVMSSSKLKSDPIYFNFKILYSFHLPNITPHLPIGTYVCPQCQEACYSFCQL